jgi:hypothetical protein
VKTRILILQLVCVVVGGFSGFAQTPTAREYFKELKATNESTKALDEYRDEFVCFDDDLKAPYFSIIAKVPDMIKMMKDSQHEAEAKKLEESRFKDSLFVQRYFKGISTQELIFSPVGTGGTDFVTGFDKPFHGKMEYTFTWRPAATVSRLQQQARRNHHHL